MNQLEINKQYGIDVELRPREIERHKNHVLDFTRKNGVEKIRSLKYSQRRKDQRAALERLHGYLAAYYELFRKFPGRPVEMHPGLQTGIIAYGRGTDSNAILHIVEHHSALFGIKNPEKTPFHRRVRNILDYFYAQAPDPTAPLPPQMLIHKNTPGARLEDAAEEREALNRAFVTYCLETKQIPQENADYPKSIYRTIRIQFHGKQQEELWKAMQEKYGPG